MFEICKLSLFEAKATTDLCQEKDENPELACMSQLQKWHKKGGGENIVPQPVMDVYISRMFISLKQSLMSPALQEGQVV